MSKAKKIDITTDVVALACMAKLLGFSAECHRTLRQIDGARRVCPTTDRTLSNMVDAGDEWISHIPDFGYVGTYLYDSLLDLNCQLAACGVEDDKLGSDPPR